MCFEDRLANFIMFNDRCSWDKLDCSVNEYYDEGWSPASEFLSWILDLCVFSEDEDSAEKPLCDNDLIQKALLVIGDRFFEVATILVPLTNVGQ